MKRKDIEAVGLPGAFVVDWPGSGPHIKATVLEVGVKPRYSSLRFADVRAVVA